MGLGTLDAAADAAAIAHAQMLTSSCDAPDAVASRTATVLRRARRVAIGCLVAGAAVGLSSSAAAAATDSARVYEQVSPADKGGSGVLLENTYALTYAIRAAADGNGASFPSQGNFAGSESGVPMKAYLSLRGDGGWVTRSVDARARGSYAQWASPMAYSPDLSKAVVGADGDPLAPGAEPNITNLYLRDNVTGTYELITENPALPALTASTVVFVGASADFSHILFENENNTYGPTGAAVHAQSLRLVEGERPATWSACFPTARRRRWA